MQFFLTHLGVSCAVARPEAAPHASAAVRINAVIFFIIYMVFYKFLNRNFKNTNYFCNSNEELLYVRHYVCCGIVAGGGQCPFVQVLRNSRSEFRLLPPV